jgi:diguanylate cyclase (GGDEF)-like protein
MIVATLAAAALMAFGLYWAAKQGDAVSIERQTRTAGRAIDDIVARVALEQETVAVWDDSVIYLQGSRQDMEWVDLNLGIWPHKIYGHDQVYILDGYDKPIYASIDGKKVPASHFEAIRGDLRLLIEDTRGRRPTPNDRFDRHPGQDVPGKAVLTTSRAVHDTQMASVGGRPAAASVMLIRASQPKYQPSGPKPIMINLRFLDHAFLKELQHRNLIDQPRYSQVPNPSSGETALELDSQDGGTIGYFIWRPELPGSRIVTVLAPTAAALVLALIALMTQLARWLRRSTGELSDTMVQLRASEAQAQHLAFHDTLTGLPNRALFNDRLDHGLARARRGQGFAVLMLDLDRFKQVNDTLGHLAGDALIREFSSRVVALVRGSDTVARLGGDEFAVLLSDVDGREEAENLCERILAEVQRPFLMTGNAAFVGVSIGVACSPEAGIDRVELMRKADIALYRAKAEGRECYRLFHDSMDESIRLRSSMEEDLRVALADGTQLRLHYQPEMGSNGNEIVGIEALVRWDRPGHGIVSPEQFVPFAEQTGLIGPLRDWVVTEACKIARRWPHLFVAVNLSPVQFRDHGVADRLIDIVRGAGVNPTQIELEVTEGVLLEDDDLVHAALGALRAAGFRIAVDDFGTGYSSLSYLRRFAFDKIKIDRSFIQQLGHEIDSASLVRAVVTIGHAMGITVTAEGVETDEQRHFLSAAGCDQMQGYLFSRPLPEEELARLIAFRGSVRAAA